MVQTFDKQHFMPSLAHMSCKLGVGRSWCLLLGMLLHCQVHGSFFTLLPLQLCML